MFFYGLWFVYALSLFALPLGVIGRLSRITTVDASSADTIIYLMTSTLQKCAQLANIGMVTFNILSMLGKGWSGVAKVSCSLRHRGVQLILAYSWARLAILVAGKGRGGMFLFLLFLRFHTCSSFFTVPLFHLLYYLFSLFSPFLWETTHNDPQELMCR